MEKPENYSATENLLQDRVILVTGAGQGIGRVAALAYANCGATVILHGRKVKKLETVYDEIEALGKAEALIYPLDFEKAEDKDFEILAHAIKEQLGRLDGILHNAALLTGLTPLEYQSVSQFRTLLQVNLVAPFAITKACLPLLKAAPDASVIMTTSSSGFNPTAYWGGFAIANSGIQALMKIQADEWDILPNLRINSIVPGLVNSPQRVITHPGELKQSMRRPEDLVINYLYLMGPDSKSMKGETLFC
ncbi:MAG: SDR family NAD(P)-dependent oxidoreductase [Nitrosomonas sp.]|nr:MAG: SDR family NAD(P)-dependent oxidoreductase [Nitrosomonas sp.]